MQKLGIVGVKTHHNAKLLHNESDCRVYKQFMQSYNSIPKSNKDGVLKKNVFDLECSTARPRPATGEILAPE